MDWRSFCLAIAVHGLLVIMLVFGLNWKTESSGPLQVELWAAGNSPVSPPPAQSKPEPPPPPPATTSTSQNSVLPDTTKFALPVVVNV